MAKEKLCPLLKKSCIEHDCRWWTRLRGKNPQGGEIDEFSCAVEWLPILLIEGSQHSRHVVAALASFRNEVHVGNEALGLILSKGSARELSAKDDPKLVGESE